MERPVISEHEMMKESELFHPIFSAFVRELDQIESTRGKLNDFQLMQAVYHAKDRMGMLGWERRQVVSSIFEKYMHIYRVFGREKADEWVTITFGFTVIKQSEPEAEPTEVTSSRVEVLSRLILEKEAELLQLYREFYYLQQDN